MKSKFFIISFLTVFCGSNSYAMQDTSEKEIVNLVLEQTTGDLDSDLVTIAKNRGKMLNQFKGQKRAVLFMQDNTGFIDRIADAYYYKYRKNLETGNIDVNQLKLLIKDRISGKYKSKN